MERVWQHSRVRQGVGLQTIDTCASRSQSRRIRVEGKSIIPSPVTQ
jgi:hypothetical protein